MDLAGSFQATVILDGEEAEVDADEEAVAVMLVVEAEGTEVADVGVDAAEDEDDGDDKGVPAVTGGTSVLIDTLVRTGRSTLEPIGTPVLSSGEDTVGSSVVTSSVPNSESAGGKKTFSEGALSGLIV